MVSGKPFPGVDRRSLPYPHRWLPRDSCPGLSAVRLRACGAEGSAVKHRCGRAAVTGMGLQPSPEPTDGHWRTSPGRPVQEPEAGRPASDLRGPPRDTGFPAPASHRGFDMRRAYLSLAVVATLSSQVAASDFATAVLGYSPGSAPANGYTESATALGAPERFTGEGLFPQAVTPFQPAFGTTEIVSIGAGGSLTLAFAAPIINDPRNPWGVDLIVFGNSMFTDGSWPLGFVSGATADGGLVEVSADGVTWHTVPGVVADGLFPTMGFTDAAPYSTAPGTVRTDFLRPLDPALTLETLSWLPYESLVAAYAGSGGGAGVDLASVGLESAIAVRIVVPADAPFHVEIDAVADVAPEGNAADLDGDGQVGGSDLALLLGAFSTVGGSADLDGDGVVGGSDLSLLLAAWGS